MKIPVTTRSTANTVTATACKTPPNATAHCYRLAGHDSPSIANDCNAFAARVAPVLLQASTSIISVQRHFHPAATYEHSIRPPSLGQQRVSPDL